MQVSLGQIIKQNKFLQLVLFVLLTRTRAFILEFVSYFDKKLIWVDYHELTSRSIISIKNICYLSFLKQYWLLT